MVFRSLPLRTLARGQIPLHVVREQPGRRLVEAHLDESTHPGRRAVRKGGLDPHRSPHTRAQVDRSHAQTRRSPIGMACHRHESRLRLEHRVIAGRVLLGSF